jgi:hypothetical protein
MLAEVIHGSSVARHAGIMPIPVEAQMPPAAAPQGRCYPI